MRPILLVEDSQDDILFVKRALEKAGVAHPLHIACDGRQALEYLQKFVDQPDLAGHPLPILVLLDLQLPHLRGLDVLKWIREQAVLQTLIVIIHSSSHLDIDIKRAYQLGANSFLVKASSGEELARMMKLVKAYWLELNASVSERVRTYGLDRGIPSLG